MDSTKRTFYFGIRDAIFVWHPELIKHSDWSMAVENYTFSDDTELSLGEIVEP